MVECQICNKKFACISNTHLKKHNITFTQYQQEYPDCKIKDDYLLIGKPLKYHINNKYFEKIDTHNKAYIIGFILADGSIDIHGHYILKIELSSRDSYILDFINRELSSNYPIIRKYKNNHIYDILQISNKQIVIDLMKLGIYQRKTYGTNIPIIPQKFRKDFFRGVFDGDGTIGNYKYKNHKNLQPSWMISCQNTTRLQNLKEYCNLNVGGIYQCVDKGSWRTSKLNDIKIIYNYMYYDRDLFCLLRKRVIFEQILDIRYKGDCNG